MSLEKKIRVNNQVSLSIFDLNLRKYIGVPRYEEV